MPILVEQFLLYIRYAVRRRWTVLVLAWLFCLIGWTVVILLPSAYQSEARIYADADSLLTPLVTGLAPGREMANQLDVLEETLLSRTNLHSVVERSGFESDQSRFEAAVSLLAAEIDIDSEGGNLFTIAYANPDPAIAHAIVSALLDTMTGGELAIDRQDVGPAQSFLEQQLVRKRALLRNAEEKLAVFQKKNVDMLAGQAQYLRALEDARSRAREIEGDANAAKARRDELARRIESLPATVRALNLAGGIPPQGSPEAEVRDLTERLSELRNRYTAQHPDVVATERALAAASERLRTGGGSSIPRVPNPVREELEVQLVELESEIASLENRLIRSSALADRLGARAEQLPEIQGELTRLTSAVEVNKRQYNDLLERRESARIVGDLGGQQQLIDFRIVDPANLPTQPASPPRLALMLGVLIAGVLVGLVGAVSAGIIQNPFESVRTLQEIYGLPVLGSVSRLTSPNEAGSVRFNNIGFGFGCLALLLLFVIIIQAENRQLFSPLRDDVQRPLQVAGAS